MHKCLNDFKDFSGVLDDCFIVIIGSLYIFFKHLHFFQISFALLFLPGASQVFIWQHFIWQHFIWQTPSTATQALLIPSSIKFFQLRPTCALATEPTPNSTLVLTPHRVKYTNMQRHTTPMALPSPPDTVGAS